MSTATHETTEATIRLQGQYVYFDGGELDGRWVHRTRPEVQGLQNGQRVVVEFTACATGGTWKLHGVRPTVATATKEPVSCLSDEQLRRLAVGNCTETDIDHVEQCPACQQRLAEFDGHEDELLRDLRAK